MNAVFFTFDVKSYSIFSTFFGRIKKRKMDIFPVFGSILISGKFLPPSPPVNVFRILNTKVWREEERRGEDGCVCVCEGVCEGVCVCEGVGTEKMVRFRLCPHMLAIFS